MKNILALSRIIVISGLRSYFVQGLLLFSLGLEVASLIYMDFFPRDVGRVSADFIVSISFFAGILFLFFHAVQLINMDEEHRSIVLFLSRPVSRGHYVLGLYVGCTFLLLILNSILALFGFGFLLFIKDSVDPFYFKELSSFLYVISFVGVTIIEMILLSVIMLISSVIRGGFLVMLLTISYYLTCNGLPVVRESLSSAASSSALLPKVTMWLTFIFPDFQRFNYKSLIATASANFDFSLFGWNQLYAGSYVALVLWLSCLIYSRRDLI